jgi:hypothetical protein
MTMRSGRIGQLREKCGAKGSDNAARLHPQDFSKLIDCCDEQDPHYSKLCTDGSELDKYPVCAKLRAATA